MSGSTDTAVVAADGAPAKVNTAPVIRAVDLIRLAQGLYFIFFGVMLASVVGAQILILLWIRTLAEVFLGIGVLAILAGTWRLRQSQLGGAWLQQTRRLLVWAGLTGYFCVLFYMWRRAPLQPYLQFNAVMFVLCGLVYLVLLAGTLRELAACLGREDLMREARWFGVSVTGLMLIPFGAGLIFVLVQAWRLKENALLQFQELVGLVNTPVLLLGLLPLSLMLGLLWATKDATLARLQALDRG
ncbi:MAG: hypothetical protein NZ483_00165 [Verrucomicrobiae bacterium]|nr:hypothetical protein [Verrucomicrobiae bacterium]MDW8343769.1 hypothetical protein [Verrucomicrobiae bacterium]